MEDIIIAITVLAVYFLPTLTALGGDHHNKRAIIVANLFLGWTGVVWLVTFIWSFTNQKETKIVSTRHNVKRIEMKDNIKLPLEFISGNNTPVTVATIKRERMEEILREVVGDYRQEIMTLRQRVQELESQLCVEDELLEEQDSKYGELTDVNALAKEIQDAILLRCEILEPFQIVAIKNISMKLSRLVNGDSNHIDTWVNVAGYALMVANELENREEPNVRS